MKSKMDLVLTVAELTQALGVSEPLAYALVRQKDFPTVHVGRRILIPREGLTAWLQRQAGMTWQDESARW